MKAAVIGCGHWGSKHVRVLHTLPEVKHVIAVDQRVDRLNELRRTFPGMGVAESTEEVIDEVDAVIIATPPESHVALALRCLRAGKAVLVEKPLATSTLDARRIVAAADRSGCVLGVGHTFEYNAAVWKLRELANSNELGRIHYLDSARLNLGLYQSDVNVVWDLAPHDISIFNYILGATPTTVQAWGSRHEHRLLEDVAYIRLMYEKPEVTATVHVSWLDPCKVRRVTVVGSAKMAVYNDLAPDERLRVYDKGVMPHEDESALPLMPISYRYGEIRSPFLASEEPLVVQDREFILCVAAGVQPRASGESGLAVVQALEAAERSLRSGRPVRINKTQVRLEPDQELVEAG